MKTTYSLLVRPSISTAIQTASFIFMMERSGHNSQRQMLGFGKFVRLLVYALHKLGTLFWLARMATMAPQKTYRTCSVLVVILLRLRDLR